MGAILTEVVRDHYKGNQSVAAKAFGCSQSHLSNLMNGKSGRGVGLPMLLLLRERTNRTIDDLLGLDTLPEERLVAQLQASLTETAKAREAMLAMGELLQEERAAAAPRPKLPKKKWTEAQEVKYRAAAQKIVDKEAKATPSEQPRAPRRAG